MRKFRHRAGTCRSFLLVAGSALLVASTGCSDSSGAAQTPPALDAAEFRSAAAVACASVVNHRRYELTSYRDYTELALQALLLSMDKPADAEPEEIAAAIGRLADESRRAAGALAQVRAAVPADQQRWDTVVQSQRDRAAFLDKRRQAVEAEQYSEIERGGVDDQLKDALDELGLRERDCGRMDAG